MKKSDLIKVRNFNYNNLFIKNIVKYNLTLNEFILLNYIINYNIETLDILDAEKYTSLSSNFILEAYNGLISKKIIKIKTTQKDDKVSELICLDDFFDNIDLSSEASSSISDIEIITREFEKLSGQKITDNEKEIIKAWVDNKIKSDLVISAIKEAKYNGMLNFRYIDKLLNEWMKENIKTSSELEESIEKNNNISKELFDYNWLDEK